MVCSMFWQHCVQSDSRLFLNRAASDRPWSRSSFYFRRLLRLAKRFRRNFVNVLRPRLIAIAGYCRETELASWVLLFYQKQTVWQIPIGPYYLFPSGFIRQDKCSLLVDRTENFLFFYMYLPIWRIITDHTSTEIKSMCFCIFLVQTINVIRTSTNTHKCQMLQF